MHGFDELKCIWTWIDTDETAEIYDNILWIGSSKQQAQAKDGWIDSDAMKFRKLASTL